MPKEPRLVDLSDDKSAWDSGIDISDNGTLFHKRRFLDYHGDRFGDSIAFRGILLGNRVLARISYERRQVTDAGLQLLSPFGASFGGPALARNLTYLQVEAVALGLRRIVDEEGADEFHIALPIRACWESSPDAMESAMRRVGFASEYRELTSVVHLRTLRVSKRARRTRAEALRRGTEINLRGPVKDFLRVLDVTYEKHGSSPTHSHEEVRRLTKMVGDDIYFPVAYFGGQPVAALGVFKIRSDTVVAFYICQDPQWQDLGALTYLILSWIESLQAPIACVSLGTSSFEGVPRYGVIEFKENFTREFDTRLSMSWRRG